jgi:predicted nucleic acid-binding protein
MHTQTTAAYQDRFEMGQRLITTTAVLNETANALSAPRFRSAVVTLHNRLTQSQQVEIILVDSELWASGWQLFADRLDKEWSLTDCISMIVCEARAITEILTTDHHFMQAGFNPILTLP